MLIRAIFANGKSDSNVSTGGSPVGHGIKFGQKWHSVFGLCPITKVKHLLGLRLRASKHRKHVNGLIKLERNMWISDKADQLDAAFIGGDMHAMCFALGAITKYAQIKTSCSKVCRVSNAEGIPTQ